MFTASAAAWNEGLISTYAFDRKRDQQAYDDLSTTHKQQREAFKLDGVKMDNTDMRIESDTSQFGTFFIIIGVIMATIVVLNMFIE